MLRTNYNIYGFVLILLLNSNIVCEMNYHIYMMAKNDKPSYKNID